MSQQSLSHNESTTTWVTFLAVGIVIVVLVLYYILIDQSIWLRLAILFGGIALAVGIVAISPEGKRFIVYARESWYEVKKVVWPTRKEATQMTLVVFGFVLIMALFLWFADKLIEWLVFSVLLGWK